MTAYPLVQLTGGQQVLQLLNGTGSITIWSTIVDYGLVAPTANGILTMPACSAADIGKTITIKRSDATSFTLVTAPNGADTAEVTTPVALNSQYGSITLECTSATGYKQVNNISQTVLAENGSVILANQVFSTNTFVNSTNGIFAIPSAGTWRIRYDINTDGTGASTNSQTQIANSLGTLVAGTERARGGGVATAQALTGEALVTTTGATTYTLQGRNGGSGSVTVLNTANSTSTISWEKISGFIPVSGQSVDYVSANLSALYSTNVAVGDHIKFNTIQAAGGVALDTSTAYTTTANVASIGRFTLIAGKTYKLDSTVTMQASAGGGRIAYAWYNADTGVQIGVEGSHFDGQTVDTNSNEGPAQAIFTPSVSTRVEVRITGVASLSSIYVGNSNIAGTRATIQQLGSSATTGGTTNASVTLADFPTGGVIGTAAATVDTANNANIVQTTSAQTLTLPSPTVTTAGKLVTINNTGTAIFTMYGSQIAPTGAGIFVWNGSAWNAVQANGSNLAAEYGENNGITANQNLTTAIADITGSSFLLPSAGTWEVEYFITARQLGTATYGSVFMTDTAGTVVPNSTIQISSQAGPTSFTETGFTQIVRIITTGATTYKLRGIAAAASSIEIHNTQFAGSLGTQQGSSKIVWNKISGNAPVTGQLQEYVAPVYAAATVVPTAGQNSSAVANSAPFMSINLPTAGTWEIEYSVRGSGTGGAAGSGGISSALYDNTPALLSSSEVISVFAATAATQNDQTTGTRTYTVTTTAAATYNVRVWNSAGTTVASAISDGNGRSYMKATKLGTSAITTTTRAIVDADLTTQVATTGADITLSGLTEFIDTTNSFTPATGIFIAPRTGFYRYEVAVAYDGNSSDGKYLKLKVNGTTVRTATNSIVAGGANLPQIVLSNIVQLTAGDSVVVTFGHSANGINTGAPVAIGGQGNHGSYNIEEITSTY
jgi:hypothetical protein